MTSPILRKLLVPWPTPPQVPQLKMSPGSSVRMLEAYSICSSGVKMNCEVLPFCLTSPLTVEADEQVHMVGHEGARHQKRPDWSEIVVALAAKPIRAECRPVGADLKVAAGNVVGSHEPGNVFEGALGVDALPFLADGERDLGLPIYLAHAQGDLDVIIGAGKTARRLQEEIGPRGRFLSSKSRPARRRHAGADHLIDVLLKVLRSVEHLPGRSTGGNARAPERLAAPGFKPSLSRKATISCSTGKLASQFCSTSRMLFVLVKAFRCAQAR